jgi:predicted membrane-bound spermidine synthase
LAAASLLFLASGATGLAYEVIWFKRFAHVWGSSSTAIAAVVASFLFGLGLGALVLGRYADRVSRPLRWYGLSELGIGVLALLALEAIRLLWRFTSALEPHIPEWPVLGFGLRFLITLLIIGPPCTLMGGTLPFLVRQFTPVRSALSRSIAWLYAVNTFGAAAGCYVTGFHLLPSLGIQWTNYLTAATSLLIGGASLILAARLAPVPVVKPGGTMETGPQAAVRDAPAHASSSGGPWITVRLAAALTGAAALILQITWNRQLAVALGGSTYAFTATLFVVLLGIACGSLVVRATGGSGFETLRRDSRIAAAVALGVAATAVAGKAALPWMSAWVGTLPHLRAEQAWNAAVSVGASAILEFLPALGMGILFPLCIHLTRGTGGRAGRAIGGIYAWNTAGSLAGATATAILVFPAGGTSLALAIAVGLYVAGAFLLAASAPPSPAGGRLGALVTPIAVAAGGLGLVLLALRPADPRATDMGSFLYGPVPTTARERTRIVSFAEGSSCNVLVTDEGTSRNLRVNGKIDATDGIDMVTQLGLAYFPRAYVPDAERVAIIGFGSGTTAGASLLFPGTGVVCCEIEPAVHRTAELFSAVNHLTATTPGLTMFFGDGRSYLQGAGDPFDLIISEPSNPWLAGVSNLFTREFFLVARERLRDCGVLAQWIQTYGFSISEYAMIVRTLKTVFPHYGLISLGEGQDTILLASTAPLAPDPAALDRLAAVIAGTPAIQADLETYFGTDDLRELLLLHHVLDESGLDRLIAGDAATTVNTDANVRLEFDAPLHLFQGSIPAPDQVPRRILAAIDPSHMSRQSAGLGIAVESPAYLLARGRLDRRQGRLADAVASLSAARRLDPARAEIYRELAAAHLQSGDTTQAIVDHVDWIAAVPGDATAEAALGGLYQVAGRTQEAVPHLRAALELDPDLASPANNLAWILATHPDSKLRDGAEAVRLAERACELTGFMQSDCLDTLAAAHAETGNFAAAERFAREALEIGGGGAVSRADVERRLALYLQHRSYRTP